MHDDLLAQAETLAGLDPKKPKQVNLRRAISAAYYAVFHFLVHESTCAQFGSSHAQRAYRDVLARAYSHTAMRSACNSFSSGNLKESVIKGLPRDSGGRFAISMPIQELAAMFSEVQQKRHLADYDRSERFARADVLTLIEDLRKSITAFASLEGSDTKRFFLACLWAWKELANR